jgi:hypothetical protein
VILTTIVHRPESSMTRTDMKLAEPVLELLASLTTGKADTDLGRTQSCCAELAAKAHTAIESLDSRDGAKAQMNFHSQAISEPLKAGSAIVLDPEYPEYGIYDGPVDSSQDWPEQLLQDTIPGAFEGFDAQHFYDVGAPPNQDLGVSDAQLLYNVGFPSQHNPDDNAFDYSLFPPEAAEGRIL